MKLISALNVACHIQSLTLTAYAMFAKKSETSFSLQILFDKGLLKKVSYIPKTAIFCSFETGRPPSLSPERGNRYTSRTVRNNENIEGAKPG